MKKMISKIINGIWQIETHFTIIKTIISDIKELDIKQYIQITHQVAIPFAFIWIQMNLIQMINI